MPGSQRRGGRGGGGREELSRDVQISKKLSWLLRHNAEKEGLKLGPGGYINVKEVMDFRAFKSLKVTFEEIREVVASDQKGRFSLIPMTELPSTALPGSSALAAAVTDSSTLGESQRLELDHDDPSNFLIRANQGHSINLPSEDLLEPITEANMPDMVVHGTTSKAWKLILKSGGLRRMGRNHVHFAAGLPRGFETLEGNEDFQRDENAPATAAKEEKPPIISGMRSSSSILIYIDLPRALASGLKFWQSENGVILSEGDAAGFVRTEFFKRVEDRISKSVLLRDGQELN